MCGGQNHKMKIHLECSFLQMCNTDADKTKNNICALSSQLLSIFWETIFYDYGTYHHQLSMRPWNMKRKERTFSAKSHVRYQNNFLYLLQNLFFFHSVLCQDSFVCFISLLYSKGCGITWSSMAHGKKFLRYWSASGILELHIFGFWKSYSLNFKIDIRFHHL